MNLGFGLPLHRHISTPFSVKEFLLDEVPGAAAAYSLRLLRAKHSGGLVRGRAWDGSEDKGEADIVYDKNFEISMDSPIERLDSKAQSLLNVPEEGGDKVLADLAAVGSGDFDVFAPKWYEQSPNANHATNSTASEQPQLVDAGNLITENGKPTLQFIDKVLSANSQVALPFTAFIVGKQINVSQGNGGYFGFGARNIGSVQYYKDNSRGISMYNGDFLRSAYNLSNAFRLEAFFNGTNSSIDFLADDQTKTQKTGDAGTDTLGGTLNIGSSGDVNREFGKNNTSELIIYDSDKRSSIARSSQESFYSI